MLWSHMHLWNIVLAIALHGHYREEVHHPAWKWYLQNIYSVEVEGIWNPSAYHVTVVLRRKRFAFHLQLSLKKVRSFNTNGRKTTRYSQFFCMQGLFLDCLRVFPFQNSIVVGVNLSIEAKMSLLAPQNIPWPIKVNHHPSKELMRKFFSNIWVSVLQ